MLILMNIEILKDFLKKNYLIKNIFFKSLKDETTNDNG